MTGKLIYCIECNKVVNFTEWDYCPEHTWQEGEIINGKRKDDRQEFLQQHKGHRTEELTP